MSKKKFAAEDLEAWILEEASIECSKCGNGDIKQSDAYYAAKDFFKDGWRQILEEVYCPKCANKKLKS